jgi:hypothetical protein
MRAILIALFFVTANAHAFDLEKFERDVDRAILTAAQGGVEIVIKTPGYVTDCPPPPPRWVKNEDGSYTFDQNLISTFAVACWTTGSERRERWTAPPTEGGTFIEVVE